MLEDKNAPTSLMVNTELVLKSDYDRDLAAEKAKCAKLLEVLRSMHIDDCGWDLDNATNTPRHVLADWHKSNNTIIEQALKEYEGK